MIMRMRFGRISKLLAGFMAAAMVIGSGATAPGNGTGDVQAGKKYPYTFPEYNIDEDHFPDAVFRQYVKDTFDQNHDNYMDSDEITEDRHEELLESYRVLFDEMDSFVESVKQL